MLTEEESCRDVSPFANKVRIQLTDLNEWWTNKISKIDYYGLIDNAGNKLT